MRDVPAESIWTFAADPDSAASGMDYRNITASGGERPMGGIANSGRQNA